MALLVHLDQFLDSYALSAAEALKRLARLQAIGLCPENNATTAGRIIDSLCRDGQTNVPVGLHERFQADVGRYEATSLWAMLTIVSPGRRATFARREPVRAWEPRQCDRTRSGQSGSGRCALSRGNLAARWSGCLCQLPKAQRRSRRFRDRLLVGPAGISSRKRLNDVSCLS